MGATASHGGGGENQPIGDATEARRARTGSSKSGDDESTLEGLMQCLCEEAGEGKEITVNDILARLAHRSYGPLILVPSLIAIFPVIGALPLVSYATALLIFLIAIQASFSQQKLWLPGRLRRASFRRETFAKGLNKARPTLRFVDGFLSRRLNFAFTKPWPMVVIWLCAILGVLMLLYAAVPGGVVAPGLALVLLSLGLTAHDGLLVALGVLAAAAVIGGSVFVVMWVF